MSRRGRHREHDKKDVHPVSRGAKDIEVLAVSHHPALDDRYASTLDTNCAVHGSTHDLEVD